MFGIAPRRGIDEPGVLVARVIRDEIEQYPDAEVCRALDEFVEIGSSREMIPRRSPIPSPLESMNERG
jgi:hypothetical protein